jgi:hypothetical protein
VADRNEIAELTFRRRALAREGKALVLRHIRTGQPIEDEVQRLFDQTGQIDAELEAAYRRGPDDDSDNGGGVRQPVRPYPPASGPGSAVEAPRV